MSKTIQIVSFDVPYPPNYGGVIDVFYKIKALSSIGINIILHTFEYGRGEQLELEKYCDKIYYYSRNSFLVSVFSKKPFIVKTRENKLLENRLVESKFPVLFEGLHSVSSLNKLASLGIKTLVRAHNVEHKYYRGLAKSETSLLKKIFFNLEAYKLKVYESILEKTDVILSISPEEQVYFSEKYGVKSHYVPVFFDDTFAELKEEEEFVLWHGDLRVSDNVKSAIMAIEAVKETGCKLIIATSQNNLKVVEASEKMSNVEINYLNKENELEDLLASAKVNLLFTFQNTGIKLKLLTAITKSRFVITNSKMIDNTGLEELCIEANDIKSVKKKLTQIMQTPFKEEERLKRRKILSAFKASNNARKIWELC